MGSKFIRIVVFFFCAAISFNCQFKSELNRGAYLGYEPPGSEPELFAPSIISTRDAKEFAITISPDGKEIYFTRSINRNQRIYYLYENSDVWTEPKPAPFAVDYGEFEPQFSVDGLKLFFSSQRPQNEDDSLNSSFNVWVVSKSDDGWNKPQYFDDNMMYVSSTVDGSIYFTDLSDPERLYIAKRGWDGYGYTETERLSDSVNSFSNSARPFIDPEETFLLFDASIDNDFNTDIYVSFKKKNGEWTKGRKLGNNVNTDKREVCPYVSPDGKYLFFSRFDDSGINIYWVDAKVIDKIQE